VGNTYAVIIAVETYQQRTIKPVKHAVADAHGFRDVLLKRFSVPEAHIKLWVDSDATQNRLINELPYEVKQLAADDRFFFYYAGHG
jgi:Caspase domain